MACCIVAAGVYVALNSLRQNVQFDISNRQIQGLPEPDKFYPYSDVSSASFRVEGITCAACTSSVEQLVGELNGVMSSRVSLLSSILVVAFDPIYISPAQISDALEEKGFPNQCLNEQQLTEREDEVDRLSTLYYNVINCAVLVIVTYVLQKLIVVTSDTGVQAIFLFFLVLTGSACQFHYGWHFYQATWNSIYFGRKLTMEALVAISTSWTFGISIWCVKDILTKGNDGLYHPLSFDLSTGTICTILAGKYSERLATMKLKSNLASLSGILPKSAIIAKANGNMVEVSCSVIKKGDLVVVRPGSKFPVDGVVSGGSSYVDQLAITGEPLPCKKVIGNSVLAGTLNCGSSLTVISSGSADESTLSKLYKLTTESENCSSGSHPLFDVIISIFVPTILVIAFGTFLYWNQYSSDLARLHSLSVVTVACPCPLGLASPAAIARGLNMATKKGCFIRDSGLTKLAKLLNKGGKRGVVFLDKTGTITTRNSEVCNVEYYTKFPKQTVWKIVRSIELFENHPIASVLSSYAGQELGDETSGEALKTLNFKHITGSGVLCEVLLNKESYEVFIGNRNWDSKTGKDIYISIRDRCVASCDISTRLRSKVKDFVFSLKSRGFEVGILTGDKKEKAEAIAIALDIQNELHFACSPKDKLRVIQNTRKCGIPVIMIGDGLNDSGALIAADLSVSLGTAHQLCIDSSLVVLTDDNLMTLIEIMDIATQVEYKIIFNILFCVIYNATMIPFAMGVLSSFGLYLSPVWAVTCMSLSSVFVLINTFTIK